MKLLMESWRQFLEEQNLTEKLMLKPGPDGWDKYAEIVAKAYLAAPKFEQRAVPHFEAMTPFVNKMFKQISSRVKIEFVDYHPYKDAQELRDENNSTTSNTCTIYRSSRASLRKRYSEWCFC